MKMRSGLYVLCTVFIALSVLSIVTADEGKKSVIADIAPFRTNKMNYLWAKVVSNIADKEAIKRIKDKFEKFDTLYLSDKDQDRKYGKSDMEEIDAKLEKVLEKYELEGAISAFNKKQKWRNEEELRKTNEVLASEKFKDAKVQKLWRAAQNSKFSESQLKVLHKELKDHERRMDEYSEKVSAFNEIPHENSLDDSEKREELSRDLKDHLNEMDSNYDQLHAKVMNTEKSPFNNAKVSELWQLAMSNQNFTTAELESIRLDLSHFDKQMDKLKYHEEELETAKQLHKDSGKVNVVHEALDEFQEKTDRIRRKLRKLGHFLQTKIAHTEL